jgi:O-antigen ligase
MSVVKTFEVASGEGRLARLGSRIGLFGLFVTALVTLGTSAAYLGALLLLAGFMLCIREWLPTVRREPVLVLIGGLIAYVLLLGLVSLSRWEGYEASTWEGITSYVFFLIMIPPIAWFFKGDVDRIRLFLLLALAGMLARIINHTDFDNIGETLLGNSQGFGLSHIAFGMYLSAALLGLAILGTTALSETRSFRARAVGGALMVLVVALLFQALVATSSRAAWIALAILGPPMVAWFHWDRWTCRKGVPGMWAIVTVSVFIAVAVTMLTYLNLDGISKRMAQEQDTIHAITSLDHERVPTDSVGTRYHMVLFGLERIGERPLFGWGPGSTRMVQLEYERDQWWYRQGRNLHNTYIHLALELGLVGFLGFGALLVMLVRYAWQGVRGAPKDRDVVHWVLGVVFMLMLWSATAYRLDKADIRFFTAVLLAIPLSMHWARVQCAATTRNAD